MTALVCSRALHDALKGDPALWATLHLVGVMRVDADEDEPAVQLELRNCGNCQSTLCVEITP